MKPTKNLFLPHVLTMLLIGGALVGCTTIPTSQQSSKTNIARAIKLVGPNQPLLIETKKALNKLPHVAIVPEDDFSEFTLIIQKNGRASHDLFTTKPAMVGILKQQKKPNNLALSYTLVNAKGNVIQKEDMIGLGEDKTGYFPALETTSEQASQQSALKDALTQLSVHLNTTLSHTPFTSSVTALLAANNQVTIQVHRNIGFTTSDRFYSKSQPKTQLRFVGFTHRVDQTHALLEVIKGPLPALGDVVVLK